MNASEKFLFEDCFDQAAQFEEPPEAEEVVPPPPTFSEEEITAAHARGFVEGRTEGIAEMQQGIDQRVNETLDRLAEGLGQIEGAQALSAELIERRLLTLAAAIARKVVPPLARDHAESTISDLIRECLPKLLDEPRIVVRLHASLIDEFRKKIDGIAAKSGYMGDIILIPDDELAETDCRVEWADGGAERSTEALWNQIENVIDTHLQPGDDANQAADERSAADESAMTEAESPEENLNG